MWRTNKTKEDVFEALKNYSEFIVFDTETTGLSAEKNHIIQISAMKITVDKDLNVEITDKLDCYINPGYSIPPKITEITGITDELLSDMPDEETVFENDVFPFFGTGPCIIAYNTPFDVKFVSAMYERNGKKFEPVYKLDVLEMARDLVEKTEDGRYKLQSVARLYGADKDITFHCSMDDVTATLRLFSIFIKEYKEKEEQKEIASKKTPKITSMHYWEGFKGCSRIYIHTNYGAFFYDIIKKKWDKKKDNLYNLDEIDMEALRKNAFEIAKVHNEAEFSRYRG